MVFLKFTILLILFIAVPFFLGNLISYKDSTELLNSFAAKFIMGHFAAFALFWILCVPFTFFRLSFTALAATYSFVLIVLCSLSIWIYNKQGLWQGIVMKRQLIAFSRFEYVYLALFLLLLGIQLYFAIFYESTIWSYDDYEYIVHSQDAITKDHMFLYNVVSGKPVEFSYKRILNSWEIYIAYLAKVSGFHVTTVAHTVIPAAFLLIAYVVYTYISKQLFDNWENRLVFLCVLSAAFMFGLYSPYALSFRLLVTLWQGKAVLSAIVLPFLIAFLPNVYRQKQFGRESFYLLITSMAACSLTMIGSGMSVVMCLSVLIVLSACKKKLTGLGPCICGCIIPAVQIIIYLTMR